MVLDHAKYLAEASKPLVRPFLHRLTDAARATWMCPTAARSTYAQSMLIPQLHTVAHIGDVVEVGVLSSRSSLSTTRYDRNTFREPGLLSQTLQQAESVELAVLIRVLNS